MLAEVLADSRSAVFAALFEFDCPGQKLGMAWVLFKSEAFTINTQNPIKDSDLVEGVRPFTHTPTKLQVEVCKEALLI